MEASAKNGDNVEEAFVATAAKVLEYIRDGVFNLNDESHGIKVGMKNSGSKGNTGKAGCC